MFEWLDNFIKYFIELRSLLWKEMNDFISGSSKFLYSLLYFLILLKVLTLIRIYVFLDALYYSSLIFLQLYRSPSRSSTLASVELLCDFWVMFMGICISLSLVSAVSSLFTGVEFLISHKIMKYLLGLNQVSYIVLSSILSILERIFIFSFLTLLMFFKVVFPFMTIYVANFINIFLFGIIAVSIFWFYQFWTVGLLVLSLFYYLFLTDNEFFLFLLSLLEIFSTIFQSITLSNRLTINIFAGSLLITLITLLLNITIISSSPYTSIPIYLFFLSFYLFEIFVLFIQLNIFILLYHIYVCYSSYWQLIFDCIMLVIFMLVIFLQLHRLWNYCCEIVICCKFVELVPLRLWTLNFSFFFCSFLSSISRLNTLICSLILLLQSLSLNELFNPKRFRRVVVILFFCLFFLILFCICVLFKYFGFYELGDFIWNCYGCGCDFKLASMEYWWDYEGFSRCADLSDNSEYVYPFNDAEVDADGSEADADADAKRAAERARGAAWFFSPLTGVMTIFMILSFIKEVLS